MGQICVLPTLVWNPHTSTCQSDFAISRYDDPLFTEVEVPAVDLVRRKREVQRKRKWKYNDSNFSLTHPRAM